jgi:hypothetical protein
MIMIRQTYLTGWLGFFAMAMIDWAVMLFAWRHLDLMHYMHYLVCKFFVIFPVLHLFVANDRVA